MAQEVELERMVVRLVGDTSQYQRSLDTAAGSTLQASGRISQSGAGAGKAVQGLNLGLAETRKSLGLLAATGAIAPEAMHSVAVLSQGFAGLRAMVAGTVGSLLSLRGALMATGIGAVVVGLGAGIALLTKWSEEAGKARESAKSTFATITSGARTARQATSDVRVASLTEGMSELADVMNPGFWRGVWNWTQEAVGLDPVQRKIDDVVLRAQNAQQMLRRLTDDPRLLRMNREIALERNTQASRDAAQALEEEATRSGIAEGEAKRYAEAQKLAREGSISLSQALERLAASHQRQRTAEVTRDLGKMQLQLRELRDEADRSGMSEVSARVRGMAQEFLRAHPHVGNLTNAFRMLAPALDETRRLVVQTSFSNFIYGLQQQNAVLGLSSERAELFRMSMDGLTDSQLDAGTAAVRHAEALKAMMAPLERLEGTRAGGAEALARIAEYQRAMSVAVNQGTARERLLRDQQLGTQAPTGPAAAGAASVAAVGDARTIAGIRATPAVPQAPTALSTAPAPAPVVPSAPSAPARTSQEQLNQEILRRWRPQFPGQLPPTPTGPGGVLENPLQDVPRGVSLLPPERATAPAQATLPPSAPALAPTPVAPPVSTVAAPAPQPQTTTARETSRTEQLLTDIKGLITTLVQRNAISNPLAAAVNAGGQRLQAAISSGGL